MHIPGLEPGEIHVWIVDLRGAPPDDVAEHLSPAEMERAARFAFDRDRHRYLRSRHVLRRLLGGYLDLDPAAVPIVLGEHGKPGLEGAHRLGFNVSHSGDRGLVAVGRATGIGVDIEEVAATRDIEGLAATVFSRGEIESLEQVAAQDLCHAFFTCWTRKEACLKALGTGFSLDPTAVEVGTGPSRRCVDVPGAPSERSVEVASIIHEPDRVAALAVVGGFTRARLEQWREEPVPGSAPDHQP